MPCCTMGPLQLLKVLPDVLSSDTIAAVASAPGSSLRGLIRVSGRDVLSVLSCVLDRAELPSPSSAHRFASHVELASLNVQLPGAVYLWPTSRSYTGEPMAELHLTGTPPLLEAVMERVLECGARAARRGEFTLRAFLAGRMDLTQAEAVLGVIDAEDHEALKTALRQLAGGFSNRLSTVKSTLLNLLADVEAGLDFVDEDIEFIGQSDLVLRLTEIRSTLQRFHEQAGRRMHSTGRRRVLLAGLPNAGKSTLFNRLAGSESAMTSSVSGTTRDWLTAPVIRESVPIEVVDTAGSDPRVEGADRFAQEGMQEQIRTADLVLWCRACDLSEDQWEADVAASNTAHSVTQVIGVQTRSDLCDPDKSSDRPSVFDGAENHQVSVSARTGAGIDQLWSLIIRVLKEESAISELVGSTASRGRDCLRRSIESISRSIDATHAGVGDELVAVEIRESLNSLGELTGDVVTDDLLDRVFSRFCIGK